MSLAVAQQLRFALHRPQAALKRLELGLWMSSSAQSSSKPTGLPCSSRICRMYSRDGKGLLVALEFTLQVRIAAADCRQFHD
jgi:hypothetical protein